MTLELTVVDAFTDRPFSGNPAAVALVEEFPDEARMQAIAAEMALSETAFAVDRGADLYDLRWFTPVAEVDLCGHATLATTHVLGKPARFQTKSGILSCTLGQAGLIEMDFPADPPAVAPAPPDLVLPGLHWFGRTRFDAFAQLTDAASVREWRADLAAVERLGGRGLILTAEGDRPGVDCVSRFFGPLVGVPEDPATGSAHCAIGPFWAERLGRTTLTGEQASRRGATISMRAEGDRVVLGGRAVTVSRVSLLV